jgi:hypothetical protein
MQRKQQVGECWVCVIFFACVCVGTSGSTTASNNPSSSSLCGMCIGRFPRGGRYAPPGYAAVPPNFFLGRFLLFLAIY